MTYYIHCLFVYVIIKFVIEYVLIIFIRYINVMIKSFNMHCKSFRKLKYNISTCFVLRSDELRLFQQIFIVLFYVVLNNPYILYVPVQSQEPFTEVQLLLLVHCLLYI